MGSLEVTQHFTETNWQTWKAKLTRYFKMIYYQNSLDLRFTFCQFVYLWNVTRPSSSTTDSQRQNEWEWEKKESSKNNNQEKIVLKRSSL